MSKILSTLTLSACLLLAGSGRYSILCYTQQDPTVVPANLPPIKFQPKEVIDVLTAYDIRHVDEIPGGKYWGLTLPYSRKIYVSQVPSFADQREIVLHELVHAIYYDMGIQTDGPAAEAAVEELAQKLYHAFYGPTVDPFQLLLESQEPTVVTSEPGDEQPK